MNPRWLEDVVVEGAAIGFVGDLDHHVPVRRGDVEHALHVRVHHGHRVRVRQHRVFAAEAALFEHIEEGVQLHLEIGTLERPFVIRDADPVRPEPGRHFAEDAQHVEAAVHEPVELWRDVLAVEISRKQQKLGCAAPAPYLVAGIVELPAFNTETVPFRRERPRSRRCLRLCLRLHRATGIA